MRSCPAVSGLLCSALERLRMLGRGGFHWNDGSSVIEPRSRPCGVRSSGRISMTPSGSGSSSSSVLDGLLRDRIGLRLRDLGLGQLGLVVRVAEDVRVAQVGVEGRGAHHRLGDVHLLVLGLRRRDGLRARRPLRHGGPDRARRVGHAGVRRADDAGDRRPGEQDDPGDEEEDGEDVRADGPDGLRAAVGAGPRPRRRRGPPSRGRSTSPGARRRRRGRTCRRPGRA